jgi:hypothetical protein
MTGLEPARYFYHNILSVARLPFRHIRNTCNPGLSRVPARLMAGCLLASVWSSPAFQDSTSHLRQFKPYPITTIAFLRALHEFQKVLGADPGMVTVNPGWECSSINHSSIALLQAQVPKMGVEPTYPDVLSIRGFASFLHFGIQYGREDLNLQSLSGTTTSTLRVCHSATSANVLTLWESNPHLSAEAPIILPLYEGKRAVIFLNADSHALAHWPVIIFSDHNPLEKADRRRVPTSVSRPVGLS